MEGNRTNRAEAPRSVPSASVRSAPLAWLAAVFLAAPAAAGSVPGPARNDPPAGASTPDPSEPAKTDADRRARIAALSVELFDLGPEQLAERAEFHRGQERAPELVAAVVLRAGRVLPPGISATRQSQREERAREAFDWLRSELAGGGAAAVHRALDRALRPAPGDTFLPDLAAAAARVVAELELVRHAPGVAALLEGRRAPGLRPVARETLHRLTGRWFDDAAAFDVAWSALVDSTPGASGRDELLAAHEREGDLLVALVEHRPAEFGPRALAADDPAVAARAAAALGRAVAAGALPPEDAIAQLRTGLAGEERGHPFDARLRALLDLVQGADPASAPAVDASSLVADLTRTQALAPACAFAVVQGLPRLPYARGGEGDPARLESLRSGVGLLRRVLATVQRRPLDPDGLEESVAALVDLAEAIEDEGLRARAAGPLVETLARLLESADPLGPGVRRAAARGLGVAPRPSDVRMLLRLFDARDGVDIDYELLGALRAAVGVLEPGAPEAEAVLSELFVATTDPDFDARLRALDVLASDELGPALAARPRRHRALWVLARLEVEGDADVRRGLVDLFGRVGDEGTLRQLLEQTSALTRIAADGAGSTDALERAVRRIAGDDPAGLAQVARETLRIAASGEESAEGSEPGAADPVALGRRSTRFALLRLGLTLGVDAARDGAACAEADHARLLRAALDLVRFEARVGATRSIEDVTLIRLVDVHVRALATDGPFQAERALGNAVLGARTALRELGAPADAGALGAAYDAAAGALAIEGVAQRLGWDLVALELDAVRTLRTLGLPKAALARLDRTLEGRGDAELDARTARAYVELILDILESPGPDRTRRALDSLEVLLAEGGDGAASADAAWATGLLTPPGTADSPDAGAERLRSALSERFPARFQALVESLRATTSPGSAPEVEPVEGGRPDDSPEAPLERP